MIEAITTISYLFTCGGCGEKKQTKSLARAESGKCRACDRNKVSENQMSIFDKITIKK